MFQQFHPTADTPNHVLIGLPNVASLRRAEAKLRANGIPHHAWSEPDGDLGFTAMATVPIGGEMRKALKDYRTWNHECAPVAQHSERGPLKAEVGGEDPPRGAMLA